MPQPEGRPAHKRSVHVGIDQVEEGSLGAQGFERPVALVSLCFLGVPCRYHGRAIASPAKLRRLGREHTLVPICPEQIAGLPTPRPAAPLSRIRAGLLKDNEGEDITEALRRGAGFAVEIARVYGAKVAFLCSGSPSCDVAGFTGRALRHAGVRVENL